MKNHKTKSRKAIDLFSGCGGLSQGLVDAGFEVLACAEIRPEARATYAENHKTTKIFEDIRLLSAKELMSAIGIKKAELDLLAACPPCQGFSSIRTRNGMIAEDERNELIFEVLRLVKELLPKCVLIENVPRLLQDARIQKFKDALSELGYEFSEGILNAKNFGVPQRRKRMILIASRLGEFGLPDKIPLRKFVRDAIGDLPPPDGDHKRPLHRLRQNFTPIVLQRISFVKKNRSELPDGLVLKCHRKYPKGFRDVYGRMDWDDVAPTITRSSHNPSKGRFIHPEQNRGITLYEAMLLQGFPRKYRFPINIGLGKISSMIGEAFPPPMAYAQANHIYKKLDEIEARGN